MIKITTKASKKEAEHTSPAFATNATFDRFETTGPGQAIVTAIFFGANSIPSELNQPYKITTAGSAMP